MKFIITLISILALAFQVKAQTNIVGFEYWFDNDFSNRVVATVAPTAQLDINSSVPTTGINPGIHSVNFRSWDDSFRYSSIISQFFYKISPSTTPTNRNIVAYEYWFDNDYANAVTQNVTSQKSLDLNTIIATVTITSGIHSFNIRLKDDTELWSTVESQFFYKVSPSTTPTNRNIVAYEYWFDNDYGNAVSQNVTSQKLLDLNTLIATGTITSGIHSFNIRLKDDTELWSTVESQFFYKVSPSTKPTNRNIVAYEYWFDNDYGNSVTQNVTSQQSLNLNTIIATGTITSGIHSFNIRFKDNTELWSAVESHFFYKASPSTAPTNRSMVAYQYWFDNDYGNAVTQNVTSQKSLDLNTIIVTGTITSGIHSFNIRLKDNTDLWSSTEIQFFYKISSSNNLASNKVTNYRYWFDDDFAQVNSLALTIPAQQFNLINNLDLTQIEKGIHTIHFQFKDSLNLWSSVVSDSITKLPLPIANFGYSSILNCDSTIITFNDSSIDGDLYLWNFGDGDTSTVDSVAHTYYATGVYNVSLTVIDTASGLDSTIVIPVTIQMNTIATIQPIACDSFVSPSGNFVWTTSNTYMDTIPNANNCDSIITVNLTINSPAVRTDTQTACDSLIWIDGNTYYASNNIATYTIVGGAANTCDSIVTLDLTILSPSFVTDIRTTCDSLVWIDGNTYYTSNNVATHTIVGGAANTCDSIVTLDLTILSPSFVTDTRIECDSLVWIDGNTYYTSNNTATHTIVGGAANTCDSIVTLDLTINTVDISLTTTSPSITANTTGAAYQWLDCDSSYAIIIGETGQTYTATTNGHYAVEITQNNCVDTSACAPITAIGLVENDFENDIILYPNPTDGNFALDLGTNFKVITITITDINGRFIQSNTFKGSQLLKMNIDQPSGIYIFTVQADDKKAVIRLVKE